MSDPARIPRILAKLGRLWGANPDWRLGEIVDAAISPTTEDPAPLSIVDDAEFERRLDATIGRYPPKAGVVVTGGLLEVLYALDADPLAFARRRPLAVDPDVAAARAALAEADAHGTVPWDEIKRGRGPDAPNP